jgi:ATP-dependent Clp protease ATP-binding subunit ClpC
VIEHLTEKSKKVIERAQEEARKLGHSVVGSEQILLGLMQDDGLAGKVFSAMQVGLNQARREVESIIGRGAGGVGNEIPLTPRARRVIERAWDEAKAMWHGLHTQIAFGRDESVRPILLHMIKALQAGTGLQSSRDVHAG